MVVDAAKERDHGRGLPVGDEQDIRSGHRVQERETIGCGCPGEGDHIGVLDDGGRCLRKPRRSSGDDSRPSSARSASPLMVSTSEGPWSAATTPATHTSGASSSASARHT